ncbi:poly(R)-hydroxyalkanoic acid synthase subunit PhaE [Halorhodospira neutriphila]|uniref:Poly(3-hydroxyalkanoate) polymerase subunit PhaE n=1 Tax=Halorhodospira neutriphila TaxID=168379 RepID=A0ABS1E597_9GAMM|nr:poly(R)-hydroxyalkanoic acid synthase subunit PhaE [Halorhodospira neutriphila]MBK1726683.1 hypothetical protein [Halorhodospira neutriphila]
MGADEAYGSEWRHFRHTAEALDALWEALQADEAVRAQALRSAVHGLQGQLDAAFTALQAAAQAPLPDDPEAGEHWLGPWLQAAARLGPLHEQAERLQAGRAALTRYRQAYAECCGLLHESAREGLARLEARLLEEAPPESLRALYELWLTEGEAAYEALLGSERWADAFGRLANASTELIGCYQAALDEGLRTLDLPNRQDLVDTQRRVAQLERQSRRQAAAEEVRGLRDEVARLRAELDRLQAAPSASPDEPSA